MKARLLFKQKHVYADGAIIEMRAWLVPKTPRTPEGYKYSMVYIDPQGKRVLGYDNAEGKGHHRHAGGDMEEPYAFESIEKMTQTFLKEIRKIRGERP